MAVPFVDYVYSFGNIYASGVSALTGAVVVLSFADADGGIAFVKDDDDVDNATGLDGTYLESVVLGEKGILTFIVNENSPLLAAVKLWRNISRAPGYVQNPADSFVFNVTNLNVGSAVPSGIYRGCKPTKPPEISYGKTQPQYTIAFKTAGVFQA